MTTQEIKAALAYANSRVSRPWCQATGEWLYPYYHESVNTGDYTNCGPWDYHTALGKRRAEMLETALELLGYDEIEVTPEEVAGLDSVAAMRRLMKS